MKITDLPAITSSTITDAFVFPVSTATETDQFSLNELQKSFTGITARTTAGLKIVGKTTPSGIFVGDNGYVGIDNNSPTVALDIGDVGTNGNGQVRVNAAAASRQISYTLKDSNVIWQTTKKASDTDYYLQFSTNGGSSYTGVLNADVNGNVGIFDGSASLSDRFYVSGGTVKFQSGNYGIVFDPSVAEIKTSVTNDVLYLNKSNNDDIVIGNNVLYIDNNTTIPSVGINTTTPTHPLEVLGTGYLASFKNNSSTLTTVGLTNTASTGYVNLIGTTLSIGRDSSTSTNNISYDLANAKLGVGTTTPDNKLHVYTTNNNTIAKFESATGVYSENIHVNNYVGDATGPHYAIHTFARGDAAGPTYDNKKWGIGLYDDGSANVYQDVFAFYVDSDTSSVSAIKAYLDRDGDFDIKGGYTTSGQYSHGKFVQIYQTKVTGNCIYFNPFSPDSNTNPSGHNDFHSPFGIVPFGGRIEKIQVLTSDTDALNLTNSPRIEISNISIPAYNASVPNGYVSGFYVSPPSNPSSFPTSGIIGYASLGTLTPNVMKTLTRTQFLGSTAFNSGTLLQYRICEADGTKTFDVDFTVVSTISFTVL